jgi:hypothetical protein
MKRMQTLLFMPFLTLAAAAFHCGVGYPAIQNDLQQPIRLTVLYRNGQSGSGEIPPGTTLWAPRGAEGIDRLEVHSDGALLFAFDKDAIDKMTSDLAPGAQVIWEVRQDGVVPTIAPD